MMARQLPAVTLRPIAPTDAAAFLAYAGDPAVSGPAGLLPVSDLAAAQARLAHAPEVLAVVHDGQVVGQVGVYARAATGPDAPDRELGYALARAYWGQGLMTAALTQVLAQLRRSGTGRVYAFVSVSNQRSAGLLRRLGFTCQDRLPAQPDALLGRPEAEDVFVLNLKNENENAVM
ncbi:GNAT family N-acetyltransferase [Lacticaseibacillus suihuaensis]